jgi:hypothetical protein
MVAAFQVAQLTQFVQNPGRIHWEALKRPSGSYFAQEKSDPVVYAVGI